ncbi:MAG: S41 family peptidase [Rikenellaceae bacterium]
MKRFLPISILTLISILSIGAVKSDFALMRDTEIMINVMRALEQNYVDSLSSSQLVSDATEGISQSLDPYTTYLSAEDMGDFEIMTTGRYGGIGAVIMKRGDYVVIAQPYKGSPADRAGLKIGDKIIEIDGEAAKGFDTKQVSDRLKGQPGSSVKVVIQSVIDSAQRRVKIKRERIAIPSIPYYGMLNGSVAYLKHTEFTDGCYDEMRSALAELREQGMSSLVLDYRGNGGGVMQEAIKILSLFVPKQSPVLVVKGRSESTTYKTTRDQIYPTMPLVVLIDGNSASAAEIVAGALQDMDRAVLVGEKSFGKGLVQSTVPVGYDSYLKLTTARYYIPSGRCIQAIDYTDHSTGRQVERVADSLRREFKTASGRTVYDGGGITPDIKVEGEYVSHFAATLYRDGFIADWGEVYYRKHHREQLDPRTFKLTDDDFNDFAKLIEGRDVKYESSVSRAMQALEGAAKREKNSELIADLKRLKGNLHDGTAANVERYREEILRYMTQDVLLRMNYYEGVVSNSVVSDPQVLRGVEILTKK